MNRLPYRLLAWGLLLLLFLLITPDAQAQSMGGDADWAFEETFNGDPTSPSQSLLPRTFDYVVTHRTHPKEHFRLFDTYLADHADNCAGPDPAIEPLPQHEVTTNHESNGTNPDPSFYICKDHMMSSMGEVDGYSSTAFWPRQAFDFTDCGVLEFDVNINDDHARSWWEVLITPRAEMKVGAADEFFPIEETYPKDRIVFSFDNNVPRIEVGAGALASEGVLVKENDGPSWAERFPEDPANEDRRIRRKMRLVFSEGTITWAIEQADGEFHEYAVEMPEVDGAKTFPFTQGLVLFKTHAYTPEKDGNLNNYTFHWDNIRFSGPVVGQYDAYEAESVIYLQANGSRPIGESQTTTITLPSGVLEAAAQLPDQPISLFGEVHSPLTGQVLLSINGQPSVAVHPYDYNVNECYSDGWKSFQLPVDLANLQEGENTFTWTIGPRPGCVPDFVWDGFSIKSLELQVAVDASGDTTATLPPGGKLRYDPVTNRCVARQFVYLPLASVPSLIQRSAHVY